MDNNPIGTAVLAAAWVILLMAVMAALAGCTQAPRPVVTTTRVEVPVVVPCRRPAVARPALSIPQLGAQPGAHLGAKVAAIQADLVAWMTYALGLEAVDGACAPIDPLDQSGTQPGATPSRRPSGDGQQ